MHFGSTNLDFILRSRGLQNVALAGFLTNCCVESTMRTAYERGFNVITLTDCVDATSEEEQRVAIEKDYPMLSRPMDHSTFLGMLAGEAVVGETSLRAIQHEFTGTPAARTFGAPEASATLASVCRLLRATNRQRSARDALRSSVDLPHLMRTPELPITATPSTTLHPAVSASHRLRQASSRLGQAVTAG